MPRAKAFASLSGFAESDIDEDMESEADAIPTPESNQENAGLVKKGRGKTKPAASKFTKSKAKAPSRRASGGSVAVAKKAAPKKRATTKRAPLNEQKNDRNPSDTEEVDVFDADVQKDSKERESADELLPVKRPAKGGRKPTAKTKKQAETEPPQQEKMTEKDGEFEYTPTVVRQSKLSKKAPQTAQKLTVNKRQPSAEPRREELIPETQPAPMDIDTSVFPEEDNEDAVPQSVFRPSVNVPLSSRVQQAPVARRRAGSASDTERTATDPALRRKLGDLTKKFENLDLKYRNLRELGIKEAEANFERLKTTSEAKAKAANDLIATLKKELATQKALAQESKSLQRQIAIKDSDVGKAQALATQLSATLSEVQNENKALQAKLANARSASAAVESVHAKTPGSAITGKGQSRTLMVGSAEAAQAAQVAQLKEDLYSDLTGLILRGVERGEECDIYDCIQTGRNGTLHFKLAVANDIDSKGGSYEDTEFSYTPRLDSNRDRDLLELLPDYLREEIMFSRLNAAMFYGRVVDTLTKKRFEERS